MKYYIEEIVTVSGAESKQIEVRTDEKDARMVYHQVLASAYAQGNALDYANVSVQNEYGGQVLPKEIYMKPEPETAE